MKDPATEPTISNTAVNFPVTLVHKQPKITGVSVGPGFHVYPSLPALHWELQHTTAERRNLVQLSGWATRRLGFQANNGITRKAFPPSRLERGGRLPIPCVLHRPNVSWTQSGQNEVKK